MKVRGKCGERKLYFSPSERRIKKERKVTVLLSPDLLTYLLRAVPIMSLWGHQRDIASKTHLVQYNDCSIGHKKQSGLLRRVRDH